VSTNTELPGFFPQWTDIEIQILIKRNKGNTAGQIKVKNAPDCFVGAENCKKIKNKQDRRKFKGVQNMVSIPQNRLAFK